MAKKETNSKKKENNKNKKSFMKDFKAELKKVIWPTPKQLLNNTVAVITIVLITAAIVFVLDFTFEALNKNGVNKIKEIVVTSTDSTSDEKQSENENTIEQEDNQSEQNDTEVNVENNEE